MWRFPEPGPNLFSSTNGILSASLPVANEDGLFVLGTLGLLSPLAAGESMDGYPAFSASLGAGLNQQVEHTLPSQRFRRAYPADLA